MLLTGSVTVNVFAGGLLTNTNQHIRFLRNPARDASLQIDAVYSNPAGLSFLADGWQASFNWQAAFQDRNISTTFAPFAGFGGNATKEFEGKAKSLFIPSAFVVYKHDKWAFSGSIAITGGGGKAKYDNGLGSFESQAAIMPATLTTAMQAVNPAFPAITQYSIESNFTGSQVTVGGQLGASYRICDNLSTFAGLRLSYVSNTYEGYLGNLQANIMGTMQSVRTFLESVNPTFAALAADRSLDVEQTGTGIAPLLGVDYKCGKFNIGLKYEFKTDITLENKSAVNTSGITAYDDGAKTPGDIPALLTGGVSYAVCDKVTVSAGYHQFFDKDADMAGDKQKALSHGTSEILAGVEWNVTQKLQLSAGAQRSDYGIRDNYLSDVSFNMDSWSVGFGFGYDINSHFTVNAGCLLTNYEDYTKTTTVSTLAYTDIYSRTSKAFGIGIDYKF
jgi:long-chain fatty acid transport protein